MGDRVRITGGFTAIPNALLRSDSLGLEHKGMISLIASHADDWDFRQSDMLKKAKCSKDKYYRIINDLKALGYLQVVPRDAVNGRFGGSDWVLHFSPRPENQDTVPRPENQDLPRPENPDTENQDDKNNNNKNKKRIASVEAHNSDFHEFMKASLRGGDEAEAGDAFFALIGDGVDPKQIIAAMRAYSEEQKDNDRSYVRFAENFLKKGFWKKYVASGKPAPASKEQQMEFWAEKINGSGFVAASSIKPTLARELVAAKLVTPEQLKARGIAA